MSVRGYADWKPKPEALYWVRRTREVLDAYEDYWPLSVRQIFYRLVADHAFPKSEAGYGKLTGYISRARRAGLLPWDAIRDGGLGRTVAAHFYADGDHFERSIRQAAANLRLDRQTGQDVAIELWCEAGGMVPILEGIAAPYSCRVNTGGGYDSVTAKHRLAERVRKRAVEDGRKTVVLHVGDFDASGEDMCAVLRDDARLMVVSQIANTARDADGWPDVPEFVAEWRAGNGEGDATRVGRWAWEFLSVERVALTGDQVIDRGVETAPPKPSDSRSAAFVERNEWVADALGTSQITAQLEALTPPELTELISSAIRDQLDLGRYEETLSAEETLRAEMTARLDR
jgi:hypothetical protein